MMERMTMQALISMTAILWVAFFGMHLYYLVLGLRETPHPSCLPLLLFVSIQSLALLTGLLLAGHQIFFKKRRLEAVGWLLLLLIPPFIWFSQVSLALKWYAQRDSDSLRPHWYSLTLEPLAAAVLDGVARWQLPHRLEGDRVVMFYGTLDNPERDLAAMDEFIKSEEAYLGRSMPSKMHWMRGSMLGVGGVAMHGLAIADPDWSAMLDAQGLRHIDRHEAAHVTITIPSSTARPPNWMTEGWAEARSLDESTLMRNDRFHRLSGNVLTVAELVSPDFYYSSNYRIYTQGGVLVAQLLRQFGPEKFQDLYLHTSEATFAADLRRVYDFDLDDLQALYDRAYADYFSFEKVTAALAAEERELLNAFRRTAERREQACATLFDDCMLKSVSSWNNRSDEPEGLLHARSQTTRHTKAGRYFRLEEKTEWNRAGKLSQRYFFQMDTPHRQWHAYRSTASNAAQKTATTGPAPRDPGIARQRRDAFRTWRPYTLFGADTTPEKYLWYPSPGTIVERVSREDRQVRVDIRYKNTEITLWLEPERDWQLLRAEKREMESGENAWEILETESRIHDENGLVWKRSMQRECRPLSGDGKRSESQNEIEITRLDRTGPEESFFSEAALPVDVVFLQANPASVRTLMHRHFAVIVTLFLLGGVFVVIGRRSTAKPVVAPSGKPDDETLQNQPRIGPAAAL